VVAAVTRHGGSIDKFMGDGILASFGATRTTASFAADALRALDALLASTAAWTAERRARGVAAPEIGAAVATGLVMFGTIGDDSRLEYTVIGEAVNLAAKLEKHTRAEGVRALCTADAYQLARSQGYEPPAAYRSPVRRNIAGVEEPVDLLVLAPL
jgi:adenylate cyclase